MIFKRETIIANEPDMNIIIDEFGNNSVAFLADIPKNAVVTGVLVNGKHLKSAKNVANEVTVDFFRDDYYDGKRVAAVLRSVYDGNEIVDAAKAFAIEKFEVEYFTVAIAEI